MNKVIHLHELLTAAKISDDEVRGGIRLSAGGLAKLATRLGVSSSEVGLLLAELTKKLHDEHERDVTAVYESQQPRFAYETDFLGNLTVRDSRTGEEHYVSGSMSAHVIRLLRATEADSDAEQDILQKIADDDSQSQSLEEDIEVSDDFSAELNNDAGSFNFPWKADDRYGTGTAAYRAKGKAFELSVISIRDQKGEEIEDDSITDIVTQQARAFIGKE